MLGACLMKFPSILKIPLIMSAMVQYYDVCLVRLR